MTIAQQISALRSDAEDIRKHSNDPVDAAISVERAINRIADILEEMAKDDPSVVTERTAEADRIAKHRELKE